MSYLRTILRPSTLSLKAVSPVTRLTSVRLQSTAPAGSLIKEVETLSNFQELIKDEKLTLSDFYATWCGPCKAISPILEKFSEKYPDVQFLKVDVDQATDIAQEYGVTAMPTFVLFKEGAPIGKIVGANPQHLQQAIEQYK